MNFYFLLPRVTEEGYNLRRSLELIFRTATQGDKQLGKLGDFSRSLPELLNPSLKGYFEALTQRDRFTAHIDEALEPWDVWLCPVAATAAFTHRPAWSAVDIDGRSYPYSLANGAYTMPSNLSGDPAVVFQLDKLKMVYRLECKLLVSGGVESSCWLSQKRSTK